MSLSQACQCHPDLPWGEGAPRDPHLQGRASLVFARHCALCSPIALFTDTGTRWGAPQFTGAADTEAERGEGTPRLGEATLGLGAE